jgi:methylated-DNA-[protein]-cysteine S-methyltransferase
MKYALIDTALGTMGLGWTAAGVARFSLPSSEPDSTRHRVARDAEESDPDPALATRILAYGEGEHVEFDDIALDVAGEPDFHRQVYDDILKLKWGETTTYGEIARRLGDVQLSRAVGHALGRNPIPLIIPCHRVLAAGGKFGGFSAPGGVNSKLRMLRLEGVAVDPPSSPQMAFTF